MRLKIVSIVAGTSPVGQQQAMDRVERPGRNPVDADGTELCAVAAAAAAAAAASGRLQGHLINIDRHGPTDGHPATRRHLPAPPWALHSMTLTDTF